MPEPEITHRMAVGGDDSEHRGQQQSKVPAPAAKVAPPAPAPPPPAADNSK